MDLAIEPDGLEIGFGPLPHLEPVHGDEHGSPRLAMASMMIGAMVAAGVCCVPRMRCVPAKSSGRTPLVARLPAAP
jgi:hypothetical protein